MYKSILKWITIPFQIRPYENKTGTGTKIYGTLIDSVCYPAGDVIVVTNTQGKEIVSNKQLYVNGNSPIKEMDNILFEGKETEVKSISYWYEKSSIAIKVVYL